MSIKDELAAELKDAMRSGDAARRNVIRQVETEVTVARSAPGFSGEVDDDLYRTVISSYVKKMRKAVEEYRHVGERGRRWPNPSSTRWTTCPAGSLARSTRPPPAGW